MKSKYFSREEFACNCKCGFDTVDAELLEVLEDLRESVGKPVIITSAARCELHNKRVGGSPNSQHRFGKAADIVVKDSTPVSIYAYLDGKYKEKYGIGLYKDWVHIDVRKDKARW